MSERPTTRGFEPIARHVQALKAKVEAAYYASRDEEAAAAHDDLIQAEHRMRVAQRVEKARHG